MKLFRLSAPLWGLALLAAPAAAEPFELKDGDRVVFVGATLIEREQRYGYWEAALTSRWPDRNVTFRNLGWSGDTVWGDARASFGTRADGFKALKDHVFALNPTVIVLGYGGNEAFDGAAGLPAFVDGLNVLLDTLAPTKARMVLLAPLREEDLGRPLPDPAAHNKDLQHLYRRPARNGEEARPDVRGHECLPRRRPQGRPADRRRHAPDRGRLLAHRLRPGARPRTCRTQPWRLELDGDRYRRQPKEVGLVATREFTIEQAKVTDGRLPLAPPPAGDPHRPTPSVRVVVGKNLTAAGYTLTIDGKPVVTASADEWAKGVTIDHGPEFDQAEQLRQAIVAKNRLYFYRWRPANETYLFGFRKAEQGQNAIEIPKFDPLIVEKEQEIAKLRVPAAHTYELKQGTDK